VEVELDVDIPLDIGPMEAVPMEGSMWNSWNMEVAVHTGSSLDSLSQELAVDTGNTEVAVRSSLDSLSQELPEDTDTLDGIDTFERDVDQVQLSVADKTETSDVDMVELGVDTAGMVLADFR